MASIKINFYRKTRARIPAPSSASFFHRKISNSLKIKMFIKSRDITSHENKQFAQVSNFTIYLETLAIRIASFTIGIRNFTMVNGKQSLFIILLSEGTFFDSEQQFLIFFWDDKNRLWQIVEENFVDKLTFAIFFSGVGGIQNGRKRIRCISEVATLQSHQREDKYGPFFTRFSYMAGSFYSYYFSCLSLARFKS